MPKLCSFVFILTRAGYWYAVDFLFLEDFKGPDKYRLALATFPNYFFLASYLFTLILTLSPLKLNCKEETRDLIDVFKSLWPREESKTVSVMYV